MNKHLQALLAKRAAAVIKMKGMTDIAAASEAGVFTEEQRVAFDALNQEVAVLDGDINRIKATMEATRAGSTVTLPDGSISTSESTDPRGGFQSFGEFAQAVRRSAMSGAQVDSRLVLEAAAPGNFANESSGADGGFLVPVEFSTNLLSASYNQVQALLPLTDNTPVQGNSMAFPVDETTPWGSSGIRAFWTDEAATMGQSKPLFDPAVLRLSKLTALVPVTDELLSDSTAIGAYLNSKTPEAIMWKTNEALWDGNGVSKPKGFFRSGALVTVLKESAQVAGTIVRQNVSKMRARMPAASYARAIWMINNDALPQLDELAYGQATTNAAIYNPVGGQFGYGTLLGRPVMVTQHNESVGAKGDIALVDWKGYQTITKAGAGIETASSMHFWFDQGITAFRAIFRVAGQSGVTKAVAPNKGSASLSPIVVLEAR